MRMEQIHTALFQLVHREQNHPFLFHPQSEALAR